MIPSARYDQRHRRRLIFNNDGCDSFVNDGRLTADGLLDARTSALADSQVDAIFYCTNKGGFGAFSHATRVGEVWTRRDGRYADNLAGALLEQGTDTLRVMADWARRNGREIFWSLRMNDTHDGWGEPGDLTHDRLSCFKREHPEFLLGGAGKPTRFGRWSAMNYALAPVREFVFQLLEEAAAGYDLDGVECDFLRHEVFFPATAEGGVCGEAERTVMTDFIRRIRAMLDRVGAARGRPLLLAVRTPDSPGLCRDLGLDMETWLAEGLVDLLAVSCYYRLTPWSVSVELGRRHGVPVYACLSESRIKLADGSFEPLRRTLAAYRGRALQAWQQGVDGIYFFNLFDPTLPIFREAGDPALLAAGDRIHVASARGLGGAHWRAPGTLRHRQLPILCPERITGCPLPLRHEIAETAVDVAGVLPPQARVELRLPLSGVDDPRQVAVRWNGDWLPGGTWTDHALRFPLRPDQVRPAGNAAGLALAGPGGESATWDDLQVWVAADGNMERMEKELNALHTG